MGTFSFEGKDYEIYGQNFLLDFDAWDENFAIGIAPTVNVTGGLSDKHWDVIRFIRDFFNKEGLCPMEYETCRANGLSTRDMNNLFPTGYMRGACKIAGITYQDRIVNYYGGKAPVSWLKAGPEKTPPKPKEKIYPIDVFGFLVDFDAWDENYALNRAYEIDIELSDRHWELIYYLRDNFRKNNVVPTLYEFCESNKVELDELEKLFPKGYHRGLLKIAGLRVIG